MEQWKPIIGYEHWYEVSNLGRVRKIETNTVLPIYKNHTVILTGKGHAKHQMISRLVINAFKPLPNADHIRVQHLDGNADNNCLSNLRWGTMRITATASTGETYTFLSEHACACELGLDQANISKCLQGKRPDHKGFTFKVA